MMFPFNLLYWPYTLLSLYIYIMGQALLTLLEDKLTFMLRQQVDNALEKTYAGGDGTDLEGNNIKYYLLIRLSPLGIPPVAIARAVVSSHVYVKYHETSKRRF